MLPSPPSLMATLSPRARVRLLMVIGAVMLLLVFTLGNAAFSGRSGRSGEGDDGYFSLAGTPADPQFGNTSSSTHHQPANTAHTATGRIATFTNKIRARLVRWARLLVGSFGSNLGPHDGHDSYATPFVRGTPCTLYNLADTNGESAPLTTATAGEDTTYGLAATALRKHKHVMYSIYPPPAASAITEGASPRHQSEAVLMLDYLVNHMTNLDATMHTVLVAGRTVSRYLLEEKEERNKRLHRSNDDVAVNSRDGKSMSAAATTTITTTALLSCFRPSSAEAFAQAPLLVDEADATIEWITADAQQPQTSQPLPQTTQPSPLGAPTITTTVPTPTTTFSSPHRPTSNGMAASSLPGVHVKAFGDSEKGVHKNSGGGMAAPPPAVGATTSPGTTILPPPTRVPSYTPIDTTTQLPTSLNNALMWQTIREGLRTSVAVVSRGQSRGNPHDEDSLTDLLGRDGNAAAPTPTVTLTAVVSHTSELLYHLLRAEDYSVGRGRTLQTPILIETIEEAVGRGAAFRHTQHDNHDSGCDNTTLAPARHGSWKSRASSASGGSARSKRPQQQRTPARTPNSRTHQQITTVPATAAIGSPFINPPMTDYDPFEWAEAQNDEMRKQADAQPRMMPLYGSPPLPLFQTVIRRRLFVDELGERFANGSASLASVAAFIANVRAVDPYPTPPKVSPAAGGPQTPPTRHYKPYRSSSDDKPPFWALTDGERVVIERGSLGFLKPSVYYLRKRFADWWGGYGCGDNNCGSPRAGDKVAVGQSETQGVPKLPPAMAAMCLPTAISSQRWYPRRDGTRHTSGEDVNLHYSYDMTAINRGAPIRLDSFNMTMLAGPLPNIDMNPPSIATRNTSVSVGEPTASNPPPSPFAISSSAKEALKKVVASASTAATMTDRPIMLKANDLATYQPYLDPSSPRYRRFLCLTYTYHGKINQATQYHETTGHLCDKHLLFTDWPIYKFFLYRMAEWQRNVVVKEPKGGEAYGNMWQKTRMLMETVEFAVRGFETKIPEEGINNPKHDGWLKYPPRTDRNRNYDHDSKNREEPTVVTSATDTTNASNLVRTMTEAKALLREPFASGFDFIVVGGDDVALNVPKMRKYFSEVDELYGAPVSTRVDRRGGGQFRSPRRHTHYRSPTTPAQMGTIHKDSVIGGTYVMNRQGYSNFMSAAFHSCETNRVSFSEDHWIGICHHVSGVNHKQATSFGHGEDMLAFKHPTGLQDLTKLMGRHAFKQWVIWDRVKAWPRGSAVLHRDFWGTHYIKKGDMYGMEAVHYSFPRPLNSSKTLGWPRWLRPISEVYLSLPAKAKKKLRDPKKRAKKLLNVE